MTNKEAIEHLTQLREMAFGDVILEALDLAIKALEFQDEFTDIVANAVVNAGCDNLEEFCEKCGIDVKEADNEVTN